MASKSISYCEWFQREFNSKCIFKGSIESLKRLHRSIGILGWKDTYHGFSDFFSEFDKKSLEKTCFFTRSSVSFWDKRELLKTNIILHRLYTAI